MEIEDVEKKQLKRDYTGTEREITEDQEEHCKSEQFLHFSINTTNVWYLRDIIAFSEEDPQPRGRIFSHKDTGRPLIIIENLPSEKEVEYCIYSMKIKSIHLNQEVEDIIIDQKAGEDEEEEKKNEEKEEIEWIRFKLIRGALGSDIERKMEKQLDSIDKHYLEEMGLLDPNLQSFVFDGILAMVAGVEHPILKEGVRKIVKSTREKKSFLAESDNV